MYKLYECISGKYQCHRHSAIWQQAAHTTCSTRAIQKILTLMLNKNLVFLEKSWENGQKNDKTERARDSTEKQESRQEWEIK